MEKNSNNENTSASSEEKGCLPIILFSLAAIFVLVVILVVGQIEKSHSANDDILVAAKKKKENDRLYSDCFHRGLVYYENRNEYPKLQDGRNTLTVVREQCAKDNLSYAGARNKAGNTARPIQSRSESMSFEACLETIRAFASQYGVTPINIIETPTVRTVRFPTIDGSVLVTCSKPDQKMVITTSKN